MHVSSVKADSLRPGEEFEMSDAAGADLLAAHPDRVERVAEEKPATVKAEPAPLNKMEPDPANKTHEPAHGKRGK
jgi:hypothetical protein